MNRFFHDKIEPCVQSLPVLRVVHSENHNGRDYQLTQTVKRNVYTEFDRSLSRHLAATGGEAFPAYTVTVEVAEAEAMGARRHLVSAFHESVPHAIKELSGRALKRAGPIELGFYRSNLKTALDPTVAQKRKITSGDVDLLETALAICKTLGDGEFLDISGDFSTIVAAPPGNMDPLIMYLSHGTVSVPSSTIPGSTPFKWPIYSFFEHAATNMAAQSYLSGVNQAILVEKEAAIREFRSITERRVVDFHDALAGRELHDHWLEAADGLLARLKAGLGEALVGISENARGIALDLAQTMESVCPRSSASKAAGAEPQAKARSVT